MRGRGGFHRRVREFLWSASALVVLGVLVLTIASCGKKGPPLPPLDEPAVSGPAASGPAAPEPTPEVP